MLETTFQASMPWFSDYLGTAPSIFKEFPDFPENGFHGRIHVQIIPQGAAFLPKPGQLPLDELVVEDSF